MNRTFIEALEKIAYWPKTPDADWVKADAWRKIALDALRPCGECHLQPDEVCDICGRRAAGDIPALRTTPTGEP